MLAIALDGSGASEEAEAALAEAFRRFPSHSGVALNLARLRLRRGAVSEALEPLRSAAASGELTAIGLLFETAWATGAHADVMDSGKRLAEAGRLDGSQAERLAELALRSGSAETDAYLRLGLDRFPLSARLHLLKAHRLTQSGARRDALDEFRASLAIAPSDLDATHNAARMLDLLGNFALAIRMNGRSRALAPGWAEGLALGARLEALHGSVGAARRLGEQAVAAAPLSATAHAAKALAEFADGRQGIAIAEHRRSLLLVPGNASEWNDRGAMLKPFGATGAADVAFRRARLIAPKLLPAIKNHAALLFDMTDMEGAVAAYDAALALTPDDAALAMKRAMTFPTILRSEAEIDAIRAEIAARMRALKNSGRRIEDPLKDVERPNFYLAYHGRNDRDLQALISDTYLALCPGLAWKAAHCAAPEPAHGRKIRIGVASRFFYDHSIRYSTAGILRNLDRERFELHIFSDRPAEELTLFREGEAADSHTLLPIDLAGAREAIAARRLDVLIYGDIGMEPLTYYLAFSRLAPVQAHLQGHPVSPGVPNIDYFISSVLQEPKNCLEHYRETPALLSGTIFCYDPVVLPQPASRASFGLPEDGALYFCPQTLFKFHPSFDAILRDILEQDRTGWLLLLKDREDRRNRDLEARLKDTLGPHADRLLWIERQAKERYFQIVRLSDVMLDTTHFSGANTTLQSLGLGIPVVHLPGEFVRGRMTLGWLREADLMEMCASDGTDYARRAVRLALDREWRGEVIARIERNRQGLFANASVVPEFEAFLEAAYAAAVAGDPPVRWGHPTG